ncbi:MAG: hypothetical protein NXI10_13840 [bacterium]|nr:hypothetical protein [bacterium]
MKRFTFLIVLVLLFASCEQKKEKVIDLSELRPQSERDYNQTDTTVVEDSTTLLLNEFQKWYPELKSIRILEERIFLERFQPLRTEKYVWYLEDGDSLEYKRMVFRDSIITGSAFYNWLDRSGTSYLGAQENIQKDPFAMMYTDTVILKLSGAIDFKKWEEIIEQEEWMDEGDYWIKQRKFGNMRWYVRKEEQLKDLTDL